MIQVLDQATINKIAAGEVIERPSAVVKELVENALDAKANAITVEIKEGGISFIRITDNGIGIEKSEIKTAFLRHATSKIKTMEDLLSISSLGFRGEALSSIAAVSMVELITKNKDYITGINYKIEGGLEKSFSEIGCPLGTTFIVKNLFYNTPARKKFLKSKTTEGNYISELIQKYSLSRPDIRFTFISDGKTKLQTSGDGQLKTNIFYNYGTDITKQLLQINHSLHGMKVSGFIGKPEVSRGNRTFINYFVNGRYIKSKTITKAIEDAYKDYLMNHRYPFVTLHLEIDSSLIDVNVHPTKMEIRFTNNDQVYELFYTAIYNTLNNVSLIPEVSLEKEPRVAQKNNTFNFIQSDLKIEPFEKNRIETNSESFSKTTTADKTTNTSFDVVKEKTDYEPGYKQLKISKEDFIEDTKPRFTIIGQVFDTYWLVEIDDKMLIIDQHAAHEKILYEKIIKEINDKKCLSQKLLSPIVVSLTAKEIECLKENLASFEKIGFSIESFGDKEYLIQAVPADFLSFSPKELFLDMLDGMMNNNVNFSNDLVLEKCASMACKAAVKGSNKLSMLEANKLIEQMLMADKPYHCPHGRPTTIVMTKQEFEKKFKRIVWKNH